MTAALLAALIALGHGVLPWYCLCASPAGSGCHWMAVVLPTEADEDACPHCRPPKPAETPCPKPHTPTHCCLIGDLPDAIPAPHAVEIEAAEPAGVDDLVSHPADFDDDQATADARKRRSLAVDGPFMPARVRLYAHHALLC